MISILMSVYIRETPAALSSALQSIVNQTKLPEEIILVKDGPLTPALDAVIDKFRLLLPLVVISLPNNIGLAGALNQGLLAATQPWVMRFDTDDICVKSRVQIQSDLISSEQFDVVGAQIAEFQTDPTSLFQGRRVPCQHAEILIFANRRCPFNHMTVCYRRSLILEIGGYPNIPLMEDYALWLKLISSGARLYNSSDVLVYARIGNGMIERRGGWKYAKSEFRIQLLMYQLNLKPLFYVIIDGFMRATVFLSPKFIRRFVYKHYLRINYL